MAQGPRDAGSGTPPGRRPGSERAGTGGPGGDPGSGHPGSGAPGSGAPGSGGRSRATDRNPWNWLLLVPLLVTLVPQLYNRARPEVLGIPFFYWYQLAVITVGVVCTYVVYVKTRSPR